MTVTEQEIRDNLCDDIIACLYEAERSEMGLGGTSNTWRYARLYVRRMKDDPNYLKVIFEINNRRNLPSVPNDPQH